MSVRLRNVLREAVLATTFRTRAVFYSDTSAPLNVVPGVNPAVGQPALPPPPSNAAVEPNEFSDFLLDLEAFGDDLSDANFGAAYDEMLVSEFIWDINDIYIDAIELLSFRLKQVADQYKNKRTAIDNANIVVADRKEATDTRSAAIVSCQTLLTNVQNQIADDSCPAVVSRHHADAWKSVRESGAIFMEEISFLSKRIDDFQNLLNAHAAQHSTAQSIQGAQRSFRWARGALYLSAFFGLIGFICGVKSEFWDKAFPTEGPSELNSAATLKTTDIMSRVLVDDLHKIQAALNGKMGTSSPVELNSDQFKKVEKALAAISDAKLQLSPDAQGQLKSILEDFKNSLSSLRSENTPTAPSITQKDVVKIINDLDTINKSLADFLKHQETPSNNKKVLFNIDHYERK